MGGNISIHALLAESDEQLRQKDIQIAEFLSTLSLRRATRTASRITKQHFEISIHALLAESDITLLKVFSICSHFYPRSPCGERHELQQWRSGHKIISIHALLAESDHNRRSQKQRHPHFYPRSPCGERLLLHCFFALCYSISIHALLAESDRLPPTLAGASSNFYPRSPCGERPVLFLFAFLHIKISIHALLAESDITGYFFNAVQIISIHALLAESDPLLSLRSMIRMYFYPRSPCGERPGKVKVVEPGLAFLSTLSLRRAT